MPEPSGVDSPHLALDGATVPISEMVVRARDRELGDGRPVGIYTTREESRAARAEWLRTIANQAARRVLRVYMTLRRQSVPPRARSRESRPARRATGRRATARSPGRLGDDDPSPLGNPLPGWAHRACAEGKFGLWHPGVPAGVAP